MSQIKIHLAALGAIIALMVIVYFATNTETVAPTEDEEYFIEINSASWGLNCRSAKNQTVDPNYPFRGDEDLPPIRKNNVLAGVNSLCNAKPACKIYISADTFGFDPDNSCTKTLEVEYRCFSFDRPWLLRGNDFETISIDCRQRPNFR